MSALAGAQFIGEVHAIASTEYTGTLDGADWRLRIPDPWNGMLVVFCRGYAGPTSITLPTLNSSGTFISATGALEQGFAVAASSYGAAGFSLLKGVDSTYQLTNYLVNTYHITGKIFLVGLSMGGSVALLLGEKYPEVYSGVLDLYGGKDWKDIYTKDKRWATLSDADLAAELTALGIPVPPPGFPTLQALRSFCAMGVADQELALGGTPETVPQAYEDCSPTYHANIMIPVITLHGTADPLIPYYQCTMYQTAVAKEHRSHLYRLYSVAGAGHGTNDMLPETSKRFVELVAWSDQLRPSPRASAFCNVTVMPGWTWSFFVHSIGGSGAISYQWYEGTTQLAGQTSMILSVTKNSPGVYRYYCKVTAQDGLTANSNTVTLTVLG